MGYDKHKLVALILRKVESKLAQLVHMIYNRALWPAAALDQGSYYGWAFSHRYWNWKWSKGKRKEE
jgi:hypothetical protein